MDLEILIAEVEQKDKHDASIVGINNTGSRSDTELRGKTALRGDATIGAFGDCDRELSVDKSLPLGRDDLRLGTIQVVTGGLRQTSGRDPSGFGVLLNTEEIGRINRGISRCGRHSFETNRASWLRMWDAKVEIGVRGSGRSWWKSNKKPLWAGSGEQGERGANETESRRERRRPTSEGR